MNQDSCSSTFERYVRYVLNGFFGRTSRERSQARMGRLSDSSCPKWTSSGTVWRGAYSMRSSSEWPSDAAVSFLSDVLEPAPPVEVLFEPEGVRGDSESSAEKRASLAEGAGRSSHSAGFKWHQGAGAGSIGLENELSPTCTARWHNPAVLTDEAGGTRKSQDVVCIAESCGSGGGVRVQGDAAPTLRENRAGTGAMIVCMADAATNAAIDEDMCGTLHVGGDAPSVCL